LNLLAGALVLVPVLSPSYWKHVGLRTHWEFPFWKSSGMSCKQHVKPLINSSEVKDLVIQLTPQFKYENKVPRVDEELLVLPVAVDGGWGNGSCCSLTCMCRSVGKLGHHLHRCTRGQVFVSLGAERGLFFYITSGEILHWAIGSGTRQIARRQKIVI
jgi:hypothetical protein